MDFIPFLSGNFDVNANHFVHRDCHGNPSQQVCFSLSNPIISTFARSIPTFLNGAHFIRPKLPLFSPPSHPFSSTSKFPNQLSI